MYQVLGGKHVRLLDREHLLDDAPQNLEGGLDPVMSIRRGVAIEELLEDLAARNHLSMLTSEALERELRIELARMWTPYEVHRDIRVDEDHASSVLARPASMPAMRPASVSASIVSISTSRPSVSRLTALRIAASLAST